MRNRLTSREQQALKLFLAEFSGKEAARELGISERTYFTHKTNAMRKLNVRSDVALVKLALATGLEAELAGVPTAGTARRTRERRPTSAPTAGSSAVDEFLRSF